MLVNDLLQNQTDKWDSRILKSNDELIEYAQMIAGNMKSHGLPFKDWDWRFIYRHLVRETKNDTVIQFIERFKSLDERNNIKIKIGSQLSILNLSISLNTSDKAYLFGFVTPKTITKIYREPTDNKIIQIEFNNDANDVYPRKFRGIHDGNEIDHSIFLNSEQSAKNAVLAMKLGDTDNILDTQGVQGYSKE